MIFCLTTVGSVAACGLAIAVLGISPRPSHAVTQVDLVISYQGTVSDPGNASASPLHRFIVGLDKVGGEQNVTPFSHLTEQHITAFSINFEGSGIYQIQPELFDQPVPTPRPSDIS